MGTYVNWTHSDHFAVYTKSESLCCTPETNIMCFNHISSKKIKSAWKWQLLYSKLFIKSKGISFSTVVVIYCLYEIH